MPRKQFDIGLVMVFFCNGIIHITLKDNQLAATLRLMQSNLGRVISALDE